MTGPDDYQSVLGIPPGPRPPNHYELLGLELFEADRERIMAAFQRRLAQTEQSRAVPADRLRPLAHEIVLAKTCLLTEKAKADYRKALALAQKYDDGQWAHETARGRLEALEAN